MKLKLNTGDRISFLGDSITSDGRWIAEITEFFLKNYPEQKIKLYNCGVSGSKGCEASLKNRLYYDCLNYFPKYVVIMFGMNDADGCLNPGSTETEKRDALLKRYEDELENTIAECLKNGAEPIICSPTPYDEYTESDFENRHIDAGLKCFRDITKKVAEKYNFNFVDMYYGMKEYPEYTLVNEDRTHPNALGHHLMAEIFLKAIGAKAEIEIDKSCEISEKNQDRYKTEQVMRMIMFVERHGMRWQYEESKTLEERKRIVKEMLDSPDCMYRETFEGYYNNIDFFDEIRAEYIRKTTEMYA